jgi:hypothetical protein
MEIYCHASVPKSFYWSEQGYLDLNHWKRLRFWGLCKRCGEPRNGSCCAAFRKTDCAKSDKTFALRNRGIRRSWLSPARFSLPGLSSFGSISNSKRQILFFRYLPSSRSHPVSTVSLLCSGIKRSSYPFQELASAPLKCIPHQAASKTNHL